jgi:hypothetical protein
MQDEINKYPPGPDPRTPLPPENPPPQPAVVTENKTSPSSGPWSILLDKIAFSILNWKSTLNGFLSIYNYLFILFTGEQFVQASGAHYAKWFLASGLVAKAITAALTADKPGTTATVATVNVQSVTIPDSPTASTK